MKNIRLPILGKITWTMLIISIVISLLTVYQGLYENYNYYSFFLILFLSFILFFSSRIFHSVFFQALKPEIIGILFLGLIFRLKWGLFNFAHLNYHGPAMFFQTFNDFRLISVYGFAYNIFWNPFTWFINIKFHQFFALNIVLSIFGALLFYIFLRNILDNNISAIVGFLAFVFAPQQVVFSASESHLNLMIFYYILIFLAISLRKCPCVRLALPFILAFVQYIRPETLIVPYIALFVLLALEYRDGAAFKFKLIIPFIIFFILTIPTYTMVIGDNILSSDKALIKQIFDKINLQSVKSLFHLIKLRPSYIFPAILIFAILGFFVSISNKAIFFAILPVHLIMISQLPAYVFKLSNWHQGIYYQQSLDLFFAVYLAVFAKYIMENVNLSFPLKRITITVLIIMIIFNFFYCIGTYNKLYDEQIEYDFIRANQNLIPLNNVLLMPFSKSCIIPSMYISTELFFPVNPFFFDEMIGPKIQIEYGYGENDEYNMRKINGLTKYSSPILYRGITLDNKDFYKICQNNQVETVKERTFIFKNRMPTLIPDNSTVTIGFYKIILDK